MLLWWLGNILLLFVVVPVVVLLLNRVLRPINEINAYANDILEHGVGITGALDAVPKLERTRQLSSAARGAATRYGAALQRIM